MTENNSEVPCGLCGEHCDPFCGAFLNEDPEAASCSHCGAVGHTIGAHF